MAVGFECMFVLIISLIEASPVCPIYALSQSGHVSLYAPERVYLSGVMCFCISRFWIVLRVLSAIFRPVFLNRLVIYAVSLPTYVKDAHFCVWVPVFLSEGVVGECPMVGVLCVWIGNPLFSMMPRMVFSSSLYSSLCRWYSFSLLCIKPYGCVFVLGRVVWGIWDNGVGNGRFSIYGNFPVGGVLWIVTSRKFSLLLVSVSAVNFMFGWCVLKSFCMLSMSV